MTRRRPAVPATLLITAISALVLSSCATFNRNDVAARVGSKSISASAARALITPDQQHTTGDLLRQSLTAWIKLDVLDEGIARAEYEKGIAGSPSVCLAAIPVATFDETTAVMAALQSGTSFADAARQFSGNTALASSGGVVLAPDGTECMAPAGLAAPVADALKTAPVGQPLAANLDTFSAVLMLRPYDDLSFASKAAVAAASVSEEQLAVTLAKADIYVDARYGRWNPETLSVVPLSFVTTGLPRVTIVGLGPGGTEYITQQTADAIARIPHRYLRTTQHPAAVLVPGASSFDDVYEDADTFADVYAEITERLVAAATEYGDVLYAVPGSPLVLERSVGRLRDDDRIESIVLPAMSFLDVAFARLGIDPIEAAVRLIDGHEFVTAAAGDRGPMFVAHTHANWVLSDIKLAVESATGDEPVVILQRLGTPEELITHTTWAELDRTVEADHLTCIYIPSLGAPVGGSYVRFHQLARMLREQCPWDREQTHQSLVKYLLEETYEVVDALQALDPEDPATDAALIEELGDLLYQVEFHATIAEQQGRFSITDVVDGIHDKLVRRHPHVFGTVQADDAGTVVANWDAIKREEKGRSSVFDGVAMSQPSLSYAYHLQRKAAKVGFDWPDVAGALPKIPEETAELIAALDGGNPAHIDAELGDLLFAVVNVARHLDIEPEAALRAATHKFRRRFEGVERLANERGITMSSADLATLDALWDEVKLGEDRTISGEQQP